MPSIRCFLCLLSVMFLLTIGHAQIRDTMLQGQVVDASGSPLPETRLIVVNLSTLEEQRAVVKEKGKFSFPLSPGDYVLIAAAPVDSPCFRPAVERVKLETDTTRNVRIVMIANPGACGAQ